MKRYNLIFMFALLIGIAFSGCNPLKKMKDSGQDVRYTVNPPVLELVGDQVAVNFTGAYPPKYFNQNVTVTLTPYLSAGSEELELTAISVQGESVRDNHRVISWENGGTFSYSESVPYRPDFQLSDLMLNIVGVDRKGRALDFDGVKIADGINVTALLVEKNGKTIFAPDQFVRTTADRYEADIRYLIQQSDVRAAETRRPEIQAFNDAITAAAANDRMSFTGTVLSAYASPDGPLDLNERLSQSRGRTSQDFWSRNFRTANVQQVMSSDLLEVVTTAEDWEGFRQLMEASNIRDKELVLRVLSMYSDPIVREREIKNIAAVFEEIKNEILPQLRRAKLTVNVKLEGWSDQELNALFDRDAALTVEEYLYTATLTQDMNRKLAIYQAAARQYQQDYRTHNNLGAALLNLGRDAEAKTALERARSISDNEIVKNNLAVVALRNNELAVAEELLNSAGSRDEVKYNLGTIKIIQGNYPDAINHFGNQVEINAGLAKLLSKDNNGAMSTLNAVRSESALIYYLRAVVGARLNNTDMVLQNLRTAASRSPELKANAAKDVEFAAFVQDPQFRAIVQ